MDNELNEVQNDGELTINDSEENLFDDYKADEDKPVEDEEESTETEELEPDPFLKIKFNGEEKILDEDEARVLAQKGMNYDRFYEPIERLARMNGMSVGDYVNKLNDTQIQYEVSNEIEKLRDNPKYEGVSDEVLEEIATARVNENISSKERQYQEEISGQAAAQEAQVQRDVEKFLDEYPEFRDKGPDALDQKVYDYINNGYSLLEAYEKWNREQARTSQAMTKMKNSQINEANRRKSLGNISNAGSADTDDFLSGFLKG
jgi:hypothetical protein